MSREEPGNEVLPGQMRTNGAIRVRLGIWIGVAALLVLVVGGYIGAGAVGAAGYRQSAEQALRQAGTENDKIYGLVKKPPSLPASFSGQQTLAQAEQTLAQSKTAVDGYGTTLKRARAIVDTELPRLRQASQKLQADSGSILVAAQRGSLDEERRRLESAIAGFLAAGEYLTIAEEQMHFASVFLDADIALLGVARLVEQQNVAGALAQFPQVDIKVQQALTLSRGEHVAPQLQVLTNSLSTFSTDFKQLLQAIQAGNIEVVQTLAPKLDQDQKASASFDEAGYNAFQAQLAKPYVDRYEKAMKQAGFKLIG